MIAIDFGMSNSAVGTISDSGPKLICLEGDNITIPSAIFYNLEESKVQFGREAVWAYTSHYESRLLRSLKSVLGSSLVDDATQIGYENVSLKDVIARFMQHLKGQATTRRCGTACTHWRGPAPGFEAGRVRRARRLLDAERGGREGQRRAMRVYTPQILYRSLRGTARPSVPEHGRALIRSPPGLPGCAPVATASHRETDNPRNPAGREVHPCGPSTSSLHGRSRPWSPPPGRQSSAPVPPVAHAARRDAGNLAELRQTAASPAGGPGAGNEYSGD